jgi:hypothetical protein
LERSKEKIKQSAGETKKINLDIYFQLDDYIKIRTGKVSKTTINVFNNIKAHLKAYEELSPKPVTFQSFDFDLYDRFVAFSPSITFSPDLRSKQLDLK